MAQASLINRAIETAGAHVVEKKVEKAVRKMPIDKQKKLTGFIMFAATLVILIVGIKKLRSKESPL